MPKYRKRPITVEAFQMTKERRKSNADWPLWLMKAWNKDQYEVGSVFPSEFPNSDGNDRLMIYTLEGKHLVNWDAYIIQGIKGELYACAQNIFEETYEKI